MAEYLTNTAELTAVANAIREKGGTSEQLACPDGFVAAIQAIQTGVPLQIAVATNAGATVTATKGSKTVSGTADASGSCTLTVDETGVWTVTAASGSMSKSIDVVVGSAEATLNLIDPVFANNDWSAIIAACQSGSVPDTWAVGASKEMTINNKAYQIDIIGKDHDDYSDGSGKAPLTFQLHDCYYENFGGGSAMNATATNVGGWTSCKMRMTALPSILTKMPAEVQAGIREVTKRVSKGNKVSTVENVTDKLFLLSEKEVYDSYSNSYNGEGTQYAYYKTSSNRIKKLDGSSKSWWLRSPSNYSTGNFCYAKYNGYADEVNANNTGYYIAFAFCF